MRLHKTGSSDWSNRGYKHKQCALADRGISYYLLFRSLRSARWMSEVAGISTVCHTIVKTARVSFGISALQGTDWLTTTIVFLRLVSYLRPGKRANKQKPFLSSRCISLPSFLAPLPLRCALQIYFLSKVCVCVYVLAEENGKPHFLRFDVGMSGKAKTRRQERSRQSPSFPLKRRAITKQDAQFYCSSFPMFPFLSKFCTNANCLKHLEP